MPHRFSFGSQQHPVGEEDIVESPKSSLSPRFRKEKVLGRLNSFSKFGHWLRRDSEDAGQSADHQLTAHGVQDLELREEDGAEELPARRPSQLSRSLSHRRRVIPGLPRQLTFSRQHSERRERLEPVEPSLNERRAFSEDRHVPFTRTYFKAFPALQPSTEAAHQADTSLIQNAFLPTEEYEAQSIGKIQEIADLDSHEGKHLQSQQLPRVDPEGSVNSYEDDLDSVDRQHLQEELDSKWILNLSMNFRDKSDREKFFVTYAQQPNKWRRLTVSCDYRQAEPETLEYDLKRLHYQRDKSMRIYEDIRESLPDIQFYDTVTNLKIETTNGRLHVHVTEDVNEIIDFPSVSLLQHVPYRYRESDLHFESHLSGFVYKVTADGRTLVKKEIPSPDTIDEFLYEVAALSALQDARSVIRLEGLVTDDDGVRVKGLLLSYANQGSLVDMLYDWKSTEWLPWSRREKWAYQIIQGLSEIHEAGFVQGDFTLSNVVIDAHDDAKVIDINRRGCPVGWEPPEMARLIACGQRIAMMIGVKTDLFQLGMVLWALAEQIDDPERVERPLYEYERPDQTVPLWYRELIGRCLSDAPQDRPSAKELLRCFRRDAGPQSADGMAHVFDASDHSISTHRSDKIYIDPKEAVDLEDIAEIRRRTRDNVHSRMTSGQSTFVDLPSSTTDYNYDSSGSYVVPRGRSRRSARRQSSPFARPVSSATSVSFNSINSRTPQWEHIRANDIITRDEKAFAPSESVTADAEDLDGSTGQGKGVAKDPVGFPPPLPDAVVLSDATPELNPANDVKPSKFLADQLHYSVAPYHEFFARSPPNHQDSGFAEYILQDATDVDAEVAERSDPFSNVSVEHDNEGSKASRVYNTAESAHKNVASLYPDGAPTNNALNETAASINDDVRISHT